MTVYGLCSLKSDGVTTATLSLAHLWPSARPVVVGECDPAGGELADRLRLSEEHGLRSLAVRARREDAVVAVREELVRAGDVDILLAPASGRASTAALARLADGLVPALGSLAGDVLMDCGRLFPDSPALALLAQADRVLLVTRASAWALRRVEADARAALGDGVAFELVLVGERTVIGPDYDPTEAEVDLALPVAGVLADDPRGAKRVGASAWWFNRSPLALAAQRVVDALCQDEMTTAAPATEQTGAPT